MGQWIPSHAHPPQARQREAGSLFYFILSEHFDTINETLSSWMYGVGGSGRGQRETLNHTWDDIKGQGVLEGNTSVTDPAHKWEHADHQHAQLIMLLYTPTTI